MALTRSEREKQVQQAEELLFAGPQKTGFAKGLFLGRYVADWVTPYPRIAAGEKPALDAALAQVRKFAAEVIDPAAIDRAADIPRPVIDGLGALGVLGMTAPKEVGGRGFSQSAYCKILEVIGARCASTCVFINAHHSIGMRGLLLFGSDEQKRRWLPDLVSGKKLAAFALTEPQAGSDAGNVQTTATPSPDGSSYTLNGEKRYITNGSIAGVLTVMARTPVPGKSDTAITAFLVTPDMPGFRITEARMEKLGIRGTATARLAFENVVVPRENILGPPGKGLKVALTVLDFGRTTFGACCTGAARTCLDLIAEHARTRRQFGRPLGDFELVKKKIAHAAANVYAMEAMTTVTAGLIDRGLEDYMLETAMLKVFSTEALWATLNDTFQTFGGAAYFTDQPLERMLRDARINQIGEGANDVLRSFVALVGMRGPGSTLAEVWDALHHPLAGMGVVLRFGAARARSVVSRPDVPVNAHALQPYARALSGLVHRFDSAVRGALIRHREAILERQYVQERIAEAAIELYASACVLSRLDAEWRDQDAPRRAAGELFLSSSARRIRRHLADLRDNDDALASHAADSWLK